MKIFILLFLISFQAQASVESDCYVSRGFFRRGVNEISHLSFFTLVDVFSLTNANTLKMTFKGEELKLVRTEILVGDLTIMKYKNVSNSKFMGDVLVSINKSPYQVITTREFNGQIMISEQAAANLIFSFSCSF
jgi:hypothetical protein